MTIDSFVQTVTGPVAVDQIGFTLPAEHIYLHHSANALRINDEDIFAGEIEAFIAVGGTCLVDVTPAPMGRDPEGLAALARRTGLTIVMSTGWYTEPTLPPEDRLNSRTTDDIARQLIDEIANGVGETGIRPGIIGEFGPVGSYLSAMDERLHRAYARAHKATGLPLSTHSWQCPAGLAQLDLLDEEGVDPRRVSIGHCDSYPVLSYWREVATRGAFVQLDTLSLHKPKVLELVVRLTREMIELGFVQHLLFSHDLGQADELRYFGGHGLTFVSERFIPALLEVGVTQEAIDTITVANPRRLLAIPARP